MKQYIFLLLCMVFVFSCKPKANMVYMSNHNFEQETNQARYTGLKIKEGDILDISVSAFDEVAARPFNLATINSTNTPVENLPTGTSSSGNLYTVSPEGYIMMPVLGKIFCKGMTKKQLREDIEDRLKTYLTDPMVDIKLINFTVSVLGEVNKPGQKTTNNEKLNLFQAIALAEDMTPAGDRTKVRLLRYSEETQKDTLIHLDFSDASIVNSPYYYLQQNDILYVEPDKNKQVAANYTNPNRALFWQLMAVLISVGALIVRFSN